MSDSKEKYGVLPAKIDLQGTRNDDVYIRFDEFTLDGSAYPDTTTARLYAIDQADGTKTITAAGVFDPDNLKKVVFKIAAADNDRETTYDYDIEVTYPNADVFTHVMGELKISADVG